jgi:DNA polymerase-3 subunit delta'
MPCHWRSLPDMDISQLSQETTILPWQQPVWQRLLQRFPQLGHGLLFYGKQGCGKQQFAAQFAKWLLCTEKSHQTGCGHCHHCAWLAAGTHPQLKVISAEFDEKKHSYGSIKVDQIREINSFVQQKVDGWRVLLLYPAENLNTAAANALLKTLEEPGERVVLILISDSALKLPATIRSRLQQFALDRVSLPQAQQYLQQQGLADAQLAQVALAMSANMPLGAQQLLSCAWFAQRQVFLAALIDLVEYKRQPLKFSSHWAKQFDVRDIIVLLRYIIQDAIAYLLQQPVKQQDLSIAAFARHYSLQQLFSIYAAINQSVAMLAQNVQAQLILDQLAMQLMSVEATTNEA